MSREDLEKLDQLDVAPREHGRLARPGQGTAVFQSKPKFVSVAFVRGPLPLLGPAFVAAIAYIDPGNFATNITAGSQFGYLLVWVVVVSNLMAMLIQYLSAKAGIATGKNLPELCRDNFRKPVTRGLWVQAELVAIATDLAEVLGGAIALQLLFGLPLLVGGVITAAVAFGLLGLQQRGARPFEVAITGLLLVVLAGFLYSLVRGGIDAGAVASRTAAAVRRARTACSWPRPCWARR